MKIALFLISLIVVTAAGATLKNANGILVYDLKEHSIRLVPRVGRSQTPFKVVRTGLIVAHTERSVYHLAGDYDGDGSVSAIEYIKGDPKSRMRLKFIRNHVKVFRIAQGKYPSVGSAYPRLGTLMIASKEANGAKLRSGIDFLDEITDHQAWNFAPSDLFKLSVLCDFYHPLVEGGEYRSVYETSLLYFSSSDGVSSHREHDLKFRESFISYRYSRLWLHGGIGLQFSVRSGIVKTSFSSTCPTKFVKLPRKSNLACILSNVMYEVVLFNSYLSLMEINWRDRVAVKKFGKPSIFFDLLHLSFHTTCGYNRRILESGFGGFIEGGTAVYLKVVDGALVKTQYNGDPANLIFYKGANGWKCRTLSGRCYEFLAIHDSSVLVLRSTK